MTDEFSLEESAGTRSAFNRVVLDFANGFLESLEDQKAYSNRKSSLAEADDWLGIDDSPTSLEQILDDFREHVVDRGLNPASGGHMGYIPGGGIYSAALGDYLAAVTNRYAGVFYASPGAVAMEEALIRWAGNLVGYDGGFGGNLTSGGSMANLIALATARTQKGIHAGNVRQSVIYCTPQTHHSIHKAIAFLGLQECLLREIGVDEKFRLSVPALRARMAGDVQKGLSPFMVVANAGSTDTGAIDPLHQIHELCEAYSAWFHIDAAYGGFFMLTKLGKDRLSGLGYADSVILDPHKGLFLPYGSGIVLVKKLKHLLDANRYNANYMQDALNADRHSPADLSPELSKHFRGMRMWLPLKLYGVGVFSEYLNEKLQLARYLYGQLQKLGFNVLCEPELSVVVFRYEVGPGGHDTLNKAILEALLKDGRVFISSTILQGRYTLRAAILSFRTHKKEVDVLLELLQQITSELTGDGHR